MRHRVIVNYAAMSEGITSDNVVEEILRQVEKPRG
mgnify:CR=1 FL=1